MKLRILHLEDSAVDAGLVADHLRRDGLDAEITLVQSEKEFREGLAEHPDVILTDYNLPTFDGLRALEIARELAPSIPFVYVSGTIGQELAVEALRGGATDYVLKEHISRLPSSVRRAIEEVRQREHAIAQAEALRSSEERLKFALLATEEVVWDWTVGDDSMWVNESLVQHWGHEIAGSRVDRSWWRTQVHPDDRPIVTESFDRALQKVSVWSSEYRFRNGRGSYRVVFERAFIVRDSEGTPQRVVGAMMDMHDRRTLEQELERSQRLHSLGRVAATMAHEFNNVLMGISSFNESIRRQADPATTTYAATEHIRRSIQRGKHVAEQILRFSRPQPPERRPVDLGPWLEKLLPELQGVAGNVRVRAITRVGDHRVLCDPAQLQQVTLNLVLNARDAMSEGGEVEIELQPAASADPPRVDLPELGRFTMLTVRDHGTGIVPEILTQIFEPMFSTKRSGTGLGLAVVQQLMVANGGHVFVESTPGVGTAFHLLLPQVEQEDLEA
ncbi:MAG TPA: ATP-binding protein [Thermoanaerobaculia bacterium]|nr:ATP-binding protein [Thermoanaerobaculia bacterium]